MECDASIVVVIVVFSFVCFFFIGSSQFRSPIRSRLGHLTFIVSGLSCFLNSPLFFISPLLKCFKRSSRQNISFFPIKKIKKSFLLPFFFFIPLEKHLART